MLTTNISANQNLEHETENKNSKLEPLRNKNVNKTQKVEFNSRKMQAKQCSTTDEIQQVIALTNIARAKSRKCGRKRWRPVGNVQTDCRLSQAALTHAQDLEQTGRLSHTGKDGSNMSDRANKHGVKWKNLGENIAQGYQSPNSLNNAWLDSTRHCNNIMNRRFKRIGVARAGDVWVVMFAGN